MAIVKSESVFAFKFNLKRKRVKDFITVLSILSCQFNVSVNIFLRVFKQVFKLI